MKRLKLLFKHETIALSPNSFNSDSSSATAILKLICQGLLKIDFDGTLAPDIALSWTASDDKRVYRFRLDPAVRFHSGRSCDAQAVVWNFRRLLSGKSDSLMAADYAGLAEVFAVEPDLVEFRFSEPNAAFLPNLAWRTFIVDDTYDQPCGTGPFKLVEWVRGSHVLLGRFDGYRKPGLPKADELEIRFAPGNQERLEILRQGGVDIVESVPAGAIQELQEQGLLCTQTAPSQHRSVVYFNCRQAPFDNVDVRRAVAHAINRPALVQAVTAGSGKIVDGILASDDIFYSDVGQINYDPELAGSLLSKAGYGKGLRINAVSTNTAPFPLIAEHIANDLRSVGIDFQFSGYDDPPWWPYMYLKGGWDMAIQGTPSRPHFDTLLSRELHSHGALNAGHYVNLAVDTLIERARRSTDIEEQKDLYASAQKIVQQDLPFFSLFASDATVGWSPQVQGYIPHPTGHIDASTAEKATWHVD